MKKTLIIAFAAALPCLAQASGTVYTDTFDTDTIGLNVTPAGWTISNGGTVDVVAQGSYGISCFGGAGACVDLDGTSNKSGDLFSPVESLVAGQTYVSTFELSGNQRIGGQTDVVDVTFGGTTASYSVAGTAPFVTESLSFTPTVSGGYTLSFLDGSSNDVGAVLDSVKIASVSAVPEPSTYALVFAGLIAVTFATRRRAAMKTIRI